MTLKDDYEAGHKPAAPDRDEYTAIQAGKPGAGAAKRIFVLDTNVLMHDPAALFRFQEHDVFLPMVVLEELDAAKKGLSEVARNVRQVSRFLDDLMRGRDHGDIEAGLPLPRINHEQDSELSPSGRLYFQLDDAREAPDRTSTTGKADNNLLAAALAARSRFPQRDPVLVSKDITLRIKATVLGIHAEDYQSDKALEDLDLLPGGYAALPETFWSDHGADLDSWTDGGRSFHRVQGPEVRHWHPNLFLHFEAERSVGLVVRETEGETAELEAVRDYTQAKHAVWGVRARNREQNFALNLLLDPEIDFVTLVGAAGTGKTLLSLAAGLAQTLDEQRYREIIMTRVTVPLGEDIGFLPGTEEEKMTPWMGALMDNLEVLTHSWEGGDWERAAAQDLLSNRIKVRSLNFMRGRTFMDRYLILDEAQNLTSKQMKTLITRAGPGTKIVCLGNLGQIDTPYLTETTSGLSYVVARFRDWPHGGHVTLARGERSRLAYFASEAL